MRFHKKGVGLTMRNIQRSQYRGLLLLLLGVLILRNDCHSQAKAHPVQSMAPRIGGCSKYLDNVPWWHNQRQSDMLESPEKNSIHNGDLIEVGGWLWADCYGAALLDSFALICNGPYIHTLDIANIDSPYVVGQYQTTTFVHDVVVRDSFAYVITTKDLMIFNISDPRSITRISDIQVTTFANWRIRLAGHIAYIADFYGIRIVDIADATLPVVQGYISTGENTVDYAAWNTKLYVGYFNMNGLDVFDVSNPSAPSWDTSVATGVASPALMVNDTLLYIAGFPMFATPLLLKIYGLADPLNPIQLGIDTIAMKARQQYEITLDTTGWFAYVSTRFDGVYSIKVSDPQNPVTVGNVTHQPTADPEGVTFSKNRLVLPSIGGAWFIDVSRPDSMVDASYFITGGSVNDFVLSDHYVFASESDAGLIILDVSDPAQPIRINATQMPSGGSAGCLAISGNYLYIGMGAAYSYIGPDSLYVYDIRDVSNPKHMTSLMFNHIGVIQAYHNRLYVTQYDTGFTIFTLEDPIHPKRTGSYEYNDSVNVGIGPISPQDSIIAVVDYQGINIFNVSDSTKPVTYTSITGGAYGVLLRDTLMYAGLIKDSEQFFIYSISNLNSPSVLGSAKFGLYGLSTLAMDTSGHYLYVGPIVVDVSNPFSPAPVDTILGSDYIYGVKAQKDILYYSDFNGLHILKNNLITSISGNPESRPLRFELKQNYPNPFNPSTVIKYRNNDFGYVLLKVYDVLGREVQTLVDKWETPGEYTVIWTPSERSTGVYFYRLQTKYFTGTGSMIYIK